MPRYVYKCSECQVSFMVRHSVGDTVEDCSVCKEKNCVTRTISNFTVKSKDSVDSPHQVGSLVKQSIEEFKKQDAPEFYQQFRPDGHSIDKEKWDIDKSAIIEKADEALEYLQSLEDSLT